MGSLQGRLLLGASVVLVAFLGLTGAGLDRAFQQSALGAVRDRLQAQIYLLLGAAEVDESAELSVPPLLPEARFAIPGSGLYAEIRDSRGRSLWRSPSLLGLEVPFPSASNPGQPILAQITDAEGGRHFSLSYPVIWEIGHDSRRQYSFRVAESRDTFDAQVYSFRRNLWGWFALAAIALLVVQGLLLRWSLTPLRQVARELTEIERGSRSHLTTLYPREIQQLTGNLNALIRHNQEHLRRSRDAMGDLAHSLKTPLAVLRTTVETSHGVADLRQTVTEQVARMSQLVEYQLQRATASGRTTLVTPVPVEPTVRKLMTSVSKVYHHKRVSWALDVAPAAVFCGDQGDLMEVIGNLVDNAFKWSRARVTVRAWPTEHDRRVSTGLVIEVEDDGPGIPPEKLHHIMRRGIRADPNTAGHGIGLAVVREVVEKIYHGHLAFDRGSLGGTRVCVWFPG
ncbi:MAG: ATP-binding protein [Gammaproteobacteria bacterium]